MGGTSTDVSRWDGQSEVVYEGRAAGVQLQVRGRLLRQKTYFTPKSFFYAKKLFLRQFFSYIF